ncbi:MAG: 5-formyltetrahydrofolate cyclo-ligase [Alloprevotella sp.]|nr:5-formyltetrahydrofolate cyclo-ligase [Alloprevotella sp.]
MSAEKDALRARIKALRREQLPTPEAHAAASRRLMSLLERHLRFQAARTVALFWSLPDEPTTHALLERMWREKTLLLPVVTGDDTMELRHFQGRESLRRGAFGILEPTGEAFTRFEALPLIVVPGVAFDRAGHRMGRGRGYYDRFLAQLPPFVPERGNGSGDGGRQNVGGGTFRLGLCFPFQLLPALPAEPWDVPVDAVLC